MIIPSFYSRARNLLHSVKTTQRQKTDDVLPGRRAKSIQLPLGPLLPDQRTGKSMGSPIFLAQRPAQKSGILLQFAEK